MRLFTALDIPDAIRQQIDGLIQDLRPTGRLRWSPAANLHITTKFIGEAPADRLAVIQDALRRVPTNGPMSIGIRGFGWLPDPEMPKVAYVAIEAPPALQELHVATDAALAELGIPPEQKPFRPHLTIARIALNERIDKLHKALAALPPIDFGEFRATEFGLYESRMQPRGSIYTCLSTYAL